MRERERRDEGEEERRAGRWEGGRRYRKEKERNRERSPYRKVKMQRRQEFKENNARKEERVGEKGQSVRKRSRPRRR